MSSIKRFRSPITLKDILSHNNSGIVPSVGKFEPRIVNYMQLIGMHKHLPSNQAELSGFVNQYHEFMCVKNNLFPMDIDFRFVYTCFFESVIAGDTVVKGFNVREFTKAMRYFLKTNADYVRDKYYRLYPHLAPKQLESTASVSEEQAIERREKMKQILKDLGASMTLINKV